MGILDFAYFYALEVLKYRQLQNYLPKTNSKWTVKNTRTALAQALHPLRNLYFPIP